MGQLTDPRTRVLTIEDLTPIIHNTVWSERCCSEVEMVLSGISASRYSETQCVEMIANMPYPT